MQVSLHQEYQPHLPMATLRTAGSQPPIQQQKPRSRYLVLRAELVNASSTATTCRIPRTHTRIILVATASQPRCPRKPSTMVQWLTTSTASTSTSAIMTTQGSVVVLSTSTTSQEGLLIKRPTYSPRLALMPRIRNTVRQEC